MPANALLIALVILTLAAALLALRWHAMPLRTRVRIGGALTACGFMAPVLVGLIEPDARLPSLDNSLLVAAVAALVIVLLALHAMTRRAAGNGPVPRSATGSSVRRSARKLARQAHPPPGTLAAVPDSHAFRTDGATHGDEKTPIQPTSSSSTAIVAIGKPVLQPFHTEDELRIVELTRRAHRAERQLAREHGARRAAESLVRQQRGLLETLDDDLGGLRARIDTLEAALTDHDAALDRAGRTARAATRLAREAVADRAEVQARLTRETDARVRLELATDRAVAIARSAIAALPEGSVTARIGGRSSSLPNLGEIGTAPAGGRPMATRTGRRPAGS